MAARAAHIFPALTGSLPSIGTLTDAGLTATYTDDSVTIQDSAGVTVLSGARSPSTRLWMIDLPTNPVLIPQAAAPQFHAAATSLCHLDQTKKNYKSTKHTVAAAPPLRPTPQIDTDLDTFPLHEPGSTNSIYTKLERTHQNFMDSTGRFPVKSRAGNEYNLIIMYSHDANYIHVEPMKRGTDRLVDAYHCGHVFFKSKGFHPKFERLDNETSKELQDYMKAENISFQYVAPHSKRRNAAERAIRTFKNHFVSTL